MDSGAPILCPPPGVVNYPTVTIDVYRFIINTMCVATY